MEFIQLATLVVLGIGVYAGYANRLFGAVTLLFTVTLASLLAANFYAPLASLFEGRLLGSLAPGACFMMIFLASLLVASMFFDRYLKKNVTLTKSTDLAGGLFVGLLIGIVMAGAVAIGWRLLPMQTPRQRGAAILGADRVVLSLYEQTSKAIPGTNLFDPLRFQVQYLPPLEDNLLHLGFGLLAPERILSEQRPFSEYHRILSDENTFFSALLTLRDTLGPEAFVVGKIQDRIAYDEPKAILDRVNAIAQATSGRTLYAHSDFTFRDFTGQAVSRDIEPVAPLVWERLDRPEVVRRGRVLYLTLDGKLGDQALDDFKARNLKGIPHQGI